MRRTPLFRLLTLLYLAAVAVLCFAKFSSLSSVPGSFLGIPTDKIVHFLMFMPFPVLALLSFELKKPHLFKLVLIVVLLFITGCLLAWATEYVQGLLPYRDMDPSSVIVFRQACAVLPKPAARLVRVTRWHTDHHAASGTREQNAISIQHIL